MPESTVKAFVTPRELAESLGLGESSVKRWADEGRLQVGRTLGGHRRIPIAQAIRFIRESGLPLLHPERLGLPSLQLSEKTSGGEAPGAATFRRLLLSGEGEEARRVLLGEFFAGRSVAALVDDLIAPAMEHIGVLWKDGVEGIFVEHRATDICAQCVRLILSYLPRPDQSAFFALGAAPSRDIHSLSTLVASAVLREKGFNSINLGAETPLDALEVAMRTYRPRVTWIAMTHEPSRTDLDGLVRGIRKIVRKARGWDGEIVLGGRAVPQSLRTSRAAGLHALDTMTQLEEWTETLLSKPGT